MVKSPPTPGLKEFAEKLIALRQTADSARKELARAKEQVTALRAEQDKLRERINKLPDGSPALKRLRDEYAQQETHLEKLARQALTLGDADVKASRELEAFSTTASAE
jgi:uncharacterized protein involved in exopolysaccharide biosynthesis